MVEKEMAKHLLAKRLGLKGGKEHAKRAPANEDQNKEGSTNGHQDEDAYLQTRKGREDLRQLVKKLIAKHTTQKIADKAIESEELHAVAQKESSQDRYLKTQEGQKELQTFIKKTIAKHAEVEWSDKHGLSPQEEKAVHQRVEELDDKGGSSKKVIPPHTAAKSNHKVPSKMSNKALKAFRNPYVGLFLAVALVGASCMVVFLYCQASGDHAKVAAVAQYEAYEARRQKEQERIREEAFSPHRSGVM